MLLLLLLLQIVSSSFPFSSSDELHYTSFTLLPRCRQGLAIPWNRCPLLSLRWTHSVGVLC
jgi:hypothetical protein